jgi:hypothetical protein
MVGPGGLEPLTSSVSRKRSNQLSYGPTGEGGGFNSKGWWAIRAMFRPRFMPWRHWLKWLVVDLHWQLVLAQKAPASSRRRKLE